MELAWGCKPHSGWAVAVLVGGSPTEPLVLDRRRVQLCPEALPRQAYHAAQGLPRAEAEALVTEVHTAVETMTAAVVDELTLVAHARGDLVAVGVVGHPHDLPELDVVLSNHSLLHAAEGELYRAALHDAAAALGVTVCAAPSKRTIDAAAAALGTSRDALTVRLTALRAALGAPWQADHRDAAAAALMALHLSR